MDVMSSARDSQAAAIKEFMFLLSCYDGVKVTIDDLLQKLCEHYDADRACTFEAEGDSETCVGTYEWCRAGALPVKENPRNTHKGTFKDWDDSFDNENSLYVEVDESFRAKNPEVYGILSLAKVERLVVAPLLYMKKVVGVLAIENPRRNTDHLLLPAIIASAIIRGIQYVRALKEEMVLKKRLEEDVSAIGGLASEYNQLMVVDLETGLFDAYVNGKRASEEFLSFAGQTDPLFYEGFATTMKFLCHPDDLEQMMKFADRSYIEECLKDRKRFSTKFRCLDLERKYIWADFILIKFDAINEAPTRISVGYVNTDAEVAAENARQAQLKDALEKAEAANIAKTNFLNNMSHDIRTPMNAVLGYARLMEKEVNNPLVMADYLKKIRFSGEYLLAIINNVLDLASIDSGKIRLDEGFMDTLDASNSFDAIIEGELKRKKIKISASGDIKHRYVFADSAKLRQIMVNLVSNAVKYTGEGGEIKLDFRELPCDREGYGTYVTTVSDNGIGMSKEFQEKIFDSFSRERNTTACGISGTGLGMSIVKKLVDLMGGTIEMESELGKGTTFRITNVHKFVDSPEEYLKDMTGQNEEHVDFKGKRILLAEDNELNAEIAKAILEDLGFEVDHVEDGVECVDTYTKSVLGHYNLILMDIQMPNMDGYKATRVIRNMENRLKANIPIYAMTANAFEEDRKKAHEAGMDGHLSKPIDVNLLVKCLRTGLSKPANYI